METYPIFIFEVIAMAHIYHEYQYGYEKHVCCNNGMICVLRALLRLNYGLMALTMKLFR